MTSNDETPRAGNAATEGSRGRNWISPGARQAVRHLIWSLAVLFVIIFAIGAANLLFTNSQVSTVRDTAAQAQANAAALAKANKILRQQVQADCDVDRDLAGLPLANAANGHPSRLAVRVISDFRQSWHRKGCLGTLPAPDPTYVAGARFYRIPVN